MTPTERAAWVVKTVRGDEIFNLPSDEKWEREIEQAIRAALDDTVPAMDFTELYDAAHAVIDHIRLHVDHAEYIGSMNAVQNFRETAAHLMGQHCDKMRIEEEDWPSLDGP